MANNKNNTEGLIKKDSLTVLYQPIVSVQEMRVYGVEALSRGDCIKDNCRKTAKEMFDRTHPAEMLHALYQACAEKAIQGFRKFYTTDRRVCLFINMDIQSLLKCNGDIDFIDALIKGNDIPPSNIAIEINAGLVHDHEIMETILRYKKQGFRLSLDHAIEGSGLLEMLLLCNPDFIKFEHAIWNNPADDIYNMDNIKIIVELCKNHGCTPIALGIEEEDDALYLLLCNITHHQGFYYTKSQGQKKDIQSFTSAIKHIHCKFKYARRDSIKSIKNKFRRHLQLTELLAKKIEDSNHIDFDSLIKTYLNKDSHIVSLFVLDSKGEQKTRRHTKARVDTIQLEIKTPQLRKGSNHSIEEYFLHIEAGFDRYVCKESISAYTGKPSSLIAKKIHPRVGTFCVLCLEVATG